MATMGYPNDSVPSLGKTFKFGRVVAPNMHPLIQWFERTRLCMPGTQLIGVGARHHRKSPRGITLSVGDRLRSENRVVTRES